MLAKEQFDKMKQAAFNHTSLTHIDYSDIADFDIVSNSDKLILLRGEHVLHWTCDSVNTLLESVRGCQNGTILQFIPLAWVESMRQAGFSEYCAFNDYFMHDITSASCDTPYEFASISDCAAVAAVTKACEGQSRGFTAMSEQFTEQWLAATEQSAIDTGVTNPAILIHREHNEIVGVLLTGIYAHGSEKGAITWIRCVAVHPRYQRRGIARALITQALAYGKAHGAKRAFLHADQLNTHAIRLYESIGFECKPNEVQIDMIKTNSE